MRALQAICFLGALSIYSCVACILFAGTLVAQQDPWLAEDVRYLITANEKAAFQRLRTAEERQRFIDQFWLHRKTPKEEYYRRFAYADAKFASVFPGWKTDFGMVYIKFGPPDAIESHAAGERWEPPIDLGGGETTTRPYKTWRYGNVKIEFVDGLLNGEYHVALDPSEKDASYRAGMGLVVAAQTGLRRETIAVEKFLNSQPLIETDKITEPPIRFQDLAAIVNTKVHYNTLPMQVRTSFTRVTDATDFANLLLQFEAARNVRIFARFTTPAHRVAGWFEDTASGTLFYAKQIPLPPGKYRLNIAVQDTVSHALNSFEQEFSVPAFSEENIGISSLILNAGTGPFLIRTSNILPRLDQIFKQDEVMGLYAEIYNPRNVANLKVAYKIVNSADHSTAFERFENRNGFLVILDQQFPLQPLAAGRYTLRITVNDVLSSTTEFIVRLSA
jgi:GWxTD domain-containing protein